MNTTRLNQMLNVIEDDLKALADPYKAPEQKVGLADRSLVVLEDIRKGLSSDE